MIDAVRPVNDTGPADTPVVIVTGLSGAGKSSALKALEDLGFEAVDNLPLGFLSRLVLEDRKAETGQPVAIGVDIRTRDFSPATFTAELRRLAEQSGTDVKLVFLDCDEGVLSSRFKATRRRHPLALDRPVSDGIAKERVLLAPLRESADVVIDTTDKTLGSLKQVLEMRFGADPAHGLTLFVTSFSFAHGLPREADLVFDVRFLDNPYYDETLRPLTGRDDAVGAHIEKDPAFRPFLDSLTALIGPLLPRYAAEGKSYLTVAVGCTGGRHRSVYTAERLARWLEARGETVHLSHRDLPPTPDAA
jgi:UPF0042 nucleotide-binding protein